MFLPSDDEVFLAAQRLGLLDSDGLLPQQNRAAAYKAALEEKKAGSTAGKDTLVSRSVVKVESGHVIIEVHYVPRP
ncbi:MAG: hypothetical protein J2P17_16860 [Mycobacterium sp.]|nr:hypothetical protein [Mycobacterium sp.]